MDNIDIFNNSAKIVERKTPLKVISWITILCLSFLIFMIVSIFYQYHQYLYYIGTVIKENDNYYVKVYIDESNIIDLLSNELIIDNNIIKYEIKSISDNYYITDINKKMYEVLISCELQEKYLLVNNLIELRFKLPKTTIMNQIINNIKKELS